MAAVVVSALFASIAAAQVAPLPAGFRVQEIPTNGTSLHVRIGGKGPAVLLQHGYGETGDMWVALAKKLAVDHMVIIPDLRGMGLSPITKGGYDKKTQGHDIAGVLDALKVQQVDIVAHDIGNMVTYAFAAEYPMRVRRFVLIDAPLPGVGSWDETRLDHHTWHFSFWGPDEDRLVAGRERIWLDRFYNELSFNPKTINEATRAHYAAIYAKPGRMHAGFEQFRAFDQDAIDDKAFVAKGKLTMPVLAIGGDHSFGAKMAEVMRFAASNVTEGIVPNSGHWIMEENPTATIALVTGFLAK
jgi:pimeloyl-ACP methyl ester carboxylesterase